MAGAVDSRTLGERVGHLSREALRAAEDALLLVLDMPDVVHPAKLDGGRRFANHEARAGGFVEGLVEPGAVERGGGQRANA